MARVWNPNKLLYEDDGQPTTLPTSPPVVVDMVPSASVRPMTGAPVDTAPDPVTASDLVVGAPDPLALSPAQQAESLDPGPIVEDPAVTTAGDALIDNADQLAANSANYKKSLGVPPAVTAAPGSSAPTGMVTTGQTSTTQTARKVMTPEEKAAQAKLDGMAGEEGSLSGQRSDEEKKLAGKNLEITKSANRDIAAAQAEADRQVAAQNQVIARLEDHVAKKRAALESRPLTSFFDPSRRTGFASFVAAISGAVGTYAAARSGGKNFAQERIDKAIDREWKEQKDQIENDRGLLSLAKQDVAAAEAKKKGMFYDLQIKKVALLDAADRTRSEELAAHGLATADIAKDEKLLAIRKKREVEVADLWKGLRKEVQTSTTTQKTPAATLAAQAASNPLAIYDGSGRYLGDSKSGPETAKSAREALGGHAKFNSSANQLLALIEKNGGTAWSGEDAGKMSSLHGALIGAARTALFPGGGTLDEGFVKLLDKMVEDPSGFSAKPRLKAQMVAKLTQTQRAVDDATKAALGAAGLKTGK